MAANDMKTVTLMVNGQQAQKSLETIEARLKTTNQSLQQMTAAGKTNTKEFQQLTKQQQRYEKQLATTQNAQRTLKQHLDSLSTQSIKQLQTSLKQLNAAFKSCKPNTPEFKAYQSAIEQTKKQLDSLAAKQKQTFAEKMFSGFANGIKGVFSSMLGPVALVTTAIAGVTKVIGGGIKTISDFSQANANLASVMGLSRKEIEDLTADAERLGGTTQYTASQITGLQTELAKLGFNKQEILDSTEAVSQFATATGSDLSEAASLCGSALRAFGLEAQDMDRVASVLAVSTTKSALSFESLNAGLSTVAPVAKQFGFSIEDTTALLGQLANSGFDASSAATATRNIFLNLANDSGKLAQALGHPVKSLDDLAPAMQELKAKGVDLAEMLELTDKRSVAAFATFLDGADSVQGLRDSITDCGDQLEEMSAKQLDTLQGDVTLMGSAWDGLMLSFGGTEGILRPVVQWLTNVITKLTEGWKKFKKYCTDFYNGSGLIRGALAAVSGGFSNAWAGIKLVLKQAFTVISSLGKVIKGVLTLDWEEIKSGVADGLKSLADNSKQFGNTLKNNLSNIWDKTFNYTPPPIEQDVELNVKSVDAAGDGVVDTSSNTSGGGTKTGKSGKDKSTKKKGKSSKTETPEQKAKKAYDAEKKVLDAAQKAKQTALMEAYSKNEMTKEDYEQRMNELTAASLQEQIDLAKKYGQDSSSLVQQQARQHMAEMEASWKKEIEAEQQSLQEQLSLELHMYSEGLVSKEEYEDEVKRLGEESLKTQLEIAKKYGQDTTKYEDELKKQREESLKEQGDKLAEAKKDAQRIVDDYAKSEAQKLQVQLDTELKLLEQYHQQGLIDEETYQMARQELIKKYGSYAQGQSQLNGFLQSDTGQALQEAVNAVSSISSELQSMWDDQRDAELAAVGAKYDKEIEAAGKNKAEQERLQAEKAKEEAAIKKKYAKKQFAAQVASAIASAALSIIQCFSQLGPIAGAVSAAIVAATTGLQIASMKRQQDKATDYYTGGYTSGGKWDQPQGTVHSNEFVANRFATRNPDVRGVLDVIDQAQKNNTIASLSSEDISRSLGAGKSSDGAAAAAMTAATAHMTEAAGALAGAVSGGIQARVEIDGNGGLWQRMNDYGVQKYGKTDGWMKYAGSSYGSQILDKNLRD